MSIESIKNRYDPENDRDPGAAVSWCDRELLAIIEEQAKRIDVLERIIRLVQVNAGDQAERIREVEAQVKCLASFL